MIESEKRFIHENGFLPSILFAISGSFGSKDLRIRVQTSLSSDSGPVPKNVIVQLFIRHKYNDEGTFLCVHC